MRKLSKKWKLWGLFLILMFFAAGATVHTTVTDVQAATKNGFKTEGGKSYYYKNGKKVKGWLTLNRKKYYFNASTGVQVKGWAKDSKGKRYFYNANGAKGYMATGWLTDSKKNTRYFNPSTGYMTTKWATISNKKYYFYSGNGVAAKSTFLTDSKNVTRYFTSKCFMATGWATTSTAKKRYFDPSTGAMYTGFRKIGSYTYYFYKSKKSKGIMATGWVSNITSGVKYYFDPSTGVMATGTKTIDGVQYTFSSSGVLQSSGSNPNTTTPSSSRTIKNFLANALKPVGQTLYVWGGGHNWSDATRKGVSSKWKQWYDNNSSSYNYRNYMDLSESTEQKGLDCSGYVGWSVYQIMQSKSGGVNYTTVSGDIGSLYSGRGMGRIISQSTLSSSNWKLYPGDIGYNDGHTWMVLGQCADKSVVILHCTPNAGVQISGTPTPNGTYGSQAIKLAETYMAKYPGVSKYDYHESSGNYIRNGAYFRWNRSTLSDPDGYLKKTANQILADLSN